MMKRLMLSCQAATELMEKKLRDELSRTEEIKLRMHSLMCAACRRYERQSQLIEQLFRAKEQAEVQTKTNAQIEMLEEKILKELKEKGME